MLHLLENERHELCKNSPAFLGGNLQVCSCFHRSSLTFNINRKFVKYSPFLIYLSRTVEAGLLWKRGCVCFPLSNSFPLFHSYVAGCSDLAQFSGPAGHIIEWYCGWLGRFHHKWHNHILKVWHWCSWKYSEERITSRWHCASALQSGTILWSFPSCFLLNMLSLWTWMESASCSSG